MITTIIIIIIIIIITIIVILIIIIIIITTIMIILLIITIIIIIITIIILTIKCRNRCRTLTATNTELSVTYNGPKPANITKKLHLRYRVGPTCASEMIQVKKFPKVSLLCRKIICSNSQSIQVQVYSLNLYYMNKLM